MDKWKNIPWQKIERNVFKLQKRIYQAAVKDDRKTVHRLQRLLMKSQCGRLLAVRRVSQDNQGKKTAGIDGVKSLTPKQRLLLSQTLEMDGKAQPVRRVWIPKPDADEKRPLGIPTMKDRAVQALVKSALEPEWEARFEPNSYGFRPGRSCHDAIEAVFVASRLQAKWVLDADIAKCFDRINHETLLDKLQTFPSLRRQVRAWLRAGMMEQGELFPTEHGTPQGGCISPLLANIALHGLETAIIDRFPRKQGKHCLHPPRVIRYADDFVVLHQSRDVIVQCQTYVEQWLAPLGLELKPSKTRLVHTLEKQEGTAGFDFLGFHIQQHPVGKYRSGRNRWGSPLGFKTLIKPSPRSVKRHTLKLRRIIRGHRTSTQAELIQALNPLVCGWSRYFAIGSSRKTLSKLREVLFQMLWGWAKRRHPNKGRYWIADKYWRIVRGRGWRFAPRDQTGRLFSHDETHILNHIKVAGCRTPYDGDWIYWSTRLGRNPTTSKQVAWLLKAQKGRCQSCGLYFRSDDRMEVDHIQPRIQGGKDVKTNLQLLHRHCHDQKTAGTVVRMKSARPFEEPYDGKLSRTVVRPAKAGAFSGSREAGPPG